MIRWVTKIEIRGKSPEAVYDWIVTLNNKRYRQWHPAHREWRAVRGAPEQIGSLVLFDEQFEGFRVRFYGEVAAAHPKWLLRWRLKRLIPLPVHLTLGFEPVEVGTIVTHELIAGYNSTFGWALDALLRRTVLTPVFEKALDRHASEEFTNLEWLL